jgi:hypothetical protein
MQRPQHRQRRSKMANEKETATIGAVDNNDYVPKEVARDFTASDQCDMKRMGKKQELMRNFHIFTTTAFTSCVVGTWEDSVNFKLLRSSRWWFSEFMMVDDLALCRADVHPQLMLTRNTWIVLSPSLAPSSPSQAWYSPSTLARQMMGL